MPGGEKKWNEWLVEVIIIEIFSHFYKEAYIENQEVKRVPNKMKQNNVYCIKAKECQDAW